MENQARIQWHPGFYGAAELEFRNNENDLTFSREVLLSKKPLQMDMLIVKKREGAVIDSEIGSLFKTYNVLEYKAPGDTLSTADFFKTIAYACLYKAQEDKTGSIPVDSITVTLIREAYPAKLMSELSPEKHSALRVLSLNAERSDVIRFLKEASSYTNPGDRNNADAVLQVSVSANTALFKMIREDQSMCEALRNLMADEFRATEENGRKEGRKEGREEGTFRTLQGLIKNHIITVKEAADHAGMTIEGFQEKIREMDSAV